MGGRRSSRSSSSRFSEDGRYDKPRAGRGGQFYQQQEQRSKRQERVGQLVRTELSRILHSGSIKGVILGPTIEAELRQRISVVSVDISPDLRQARIAVSIRTPRIKNPPQLMTTTTTTTTTRASQISLSQQQQPLEGEDEDVLCIASGDATKDAVSLTDDPPPSSSSSSLSDSAAVSTTSAMISSPSPPSIIMDKRRAYSWLVQNTKSIRHTLAQRMSHMKTCPMLTFNQVDVAAAVDVMYLIDQLSANGGGANVKRPTIDWWDGAPSTDEWDFDDDNNDDDNNDDDNDDEGASDSITLKNTRQRELDLEEDEDGEDDEDDDGEWIEDEKGFFNNK